MKKTKLKPEPFREPELERAYQKVQPALRKLKRMEKAGKFRYLD